VAEGGSHPLDRKSNLELEEVKKGWGRMEEHFIVRKRGGGHTSHLGGGTGRDGVSGTSGKS